MALLCLVATVYGPAPGLAEADMSVEPRTIVSSVDIGLHTATVTDIAVDAQGFTWFAGRTGVGRVGRLGVDTFDMVEVEGADRSERRVFLHEATSFIPDPETGIWIANGSLLYLDPWSRRVTGLDMAAERLVETRDGFWIVANGIARVWAFDAERAGPPIQLPELSRLDLGSVASSDPDGNLHIVSGEKLVTVTRAGDDHAHHLTGGAASVAPRSEGGTWIVGPAGVWVYADHESRPRRLAPPPQGTTLSAVAELSPERLLVGTRNGELLMLDADTGAWGEPDSLPFENAPVSHIIRGDDDDLWVSQDGGLVHLAQRESGLQFFPFPEQESGFMASAVAAGDSDVYVGTPTSEVWRLEPATGSWSRSPENVNDATINTNGAINSLAVAGSDLWVGVTDLFVLTADIAATSPEAPRRYALDPIEAMTIDQARGEVWLTIDWGIVVDRFDRTRRKFIEADDIGVDLPIHSLLVGNEDVYLGTSGRVTAIDKITFEIGAEFDAGGAFGSSPVSVMHLEGGGDRLWVAAGNRLVAIDPSDNSHVVHGDESGLPGFRIVAIADHPRRNALWLATTSGLYLFDKTDGRTIGVFGTMDGLGSEAFEEQVPVVLEDQSIGFLTDKGLAVVPPDFPSGRFGSSGRVYVECRSGCGTDYDGQTVRSSEVVRFGILVPIDTDQGLRVQYRLRGLEEGWSDADEFGSATYQNLGRGKYEFEVRGVTLAGDVILADLDGPGGSIAVDNPIEWYRRTDVQVGLVIGLLVLAIVNLQRRSRQARRWRTHLQREVEERTRDLELARVKAEESNETKTRFLATITHDLRTPLTTILGFADLAALDASPPTDGFIRNINTAGTHLAQMIEDLISVAHGSAQRDAASGHVVDLANVMSDVLAMLELRAAERNMTVTAQVLVDGPVTLPLEQGAWSRILINLVANAINHSGGSAVEVRLEPATLADSGGVQRPAVRFCVTDDGGSFPPDRAGELVERFLRGPNAAAGGMGLGLSIVDDLIRSVGSELEIEVAPGIYTEFSTTVAVADHDGLSTARIATDQESTKVAWVVDDEPLVLEFICQIVEGMGFDVERFSRADDALAKLNGPPPVCVVTDVVMSPVDGVELARQVRDNFGEEVWIVAVTGLPEQLIEKEAFDVVVRKPMAVNTLREEIARYSTNTSST